MVGENFVNLGPLIPKNAMKTKEICKMHILLLIFNFSSNFSMKFVFSTYFNAKKPKFGLYSAKMNKITATKI